MWVTIRGPNRHFQAVFREVWLTLGGEKTKNLNWIYAHVLGPVCD